MGLREDIDKWIDANREGFLGSLSELIQTRTENLPPKGEEKPGQEYLYNKVSSFLPKSNLDMFEIDDVPGIRENPYFFGTMAGMEKEYAGRPNLVAKLPGKGGGKSLAFSGHMDTMPAGDEGWDVFPDPFSGKTKDGKMYGRGSMDMKAGTLAGFYALKCIKDLGLELKSDVFAESVIDEENGGVNGSVAARLRNPDIDFAIISEPTDLVVGIETIGGSDWKATVKEKGAGGFGFGQEIPNPVYKIAKVATALEKYDQYRRKTLKAPDNYDPNSHLQLLTFQIHSGGASYLESGAIPTEGHIYFWLEVYSHMKEEDVRKDFHDFMKKELSSYPEFKDSFPAFETVIRFMGGHKTDPSHPALNSIKKAYADTGIEYKAQGLDLACDAYVYKPITGKTDVVVMGPVGGNAHGKDEWVDIESVLKLMKVMVLTAADFCG